MAFCGQCGLLLNTNVTKCPRCGAATDFDVATSGTPEDDNSTTVIAHTENTRAGTPPRPLPSDASNAGYYTASGGNAYPEQKAQQADHSPNSSYLTPGAFQPQDNNIFTAPDSMPQRGNQAPGMYQPGGIPSTNPNYSFQPPTPHRKTRKWPFILVIVLIVALGAVTVMFFTLGPGPFAGLFGTNNTPAAQGTLTTQPAPTTAQQNTPTTTGTTPTQQAQATIQHYYADINSQDYQDAYNLWVSNPDNYNHYKQGFAHTHHDTITFGNAIPQVDGTVQVNITVQATEDAGGGTKISTYQGYYTVGQQVGGSWKIIVGQLA